MGRPSFTGSDVKDINVTPVWLYTLSYVPWMKSKHIVMKYCNPGLVFMRRWKFRCYGIFLQKSLNIERHSKQNDSRNVKMLNKKKVNLTEFLNESAYWTVLHHRRSAGGWLKFHCVVSWVNTMWESCYLWACD